MQGGVNLNLAPVVLFVYNRPEKTKKTLEALLNNHLAKETFITIYSDAAKKSSDVENVTRVREQLKKYSYLNNINIIEREQNWGLAKSIIAGVTENVNKYGKVIVLEDDIVTNGNFLKFMNDALCRYEKVKNVMHISGYIFPFNKKNLDDTFFLRPTTCWGWATWKRAWETFNYDADYLMAQFNKRSIGDFNLSRSYNYFSHLQKNKANKLNTWAIFWYASVYLQGGLSLHPKYSFVNNIGHDGDGTNSGVTSVYDVKLIENYPIELTSKIEECTVARSRLESYFRDLKVSLMRRVFNKAKRLLLEN